MAVHKEIAFQGNSPLPSAKPNRRHRSAPVFNGIQEFRTKFSTLNIKFSKLDKGLFSCKRRKIPHRFTALRPATVIVAAHPRSNLNNSPGWVRGLAGEV
jgi:hypothetical protein